MASIKRTVEILKSESCNIILNPKSAKCEILGFRKILKIYLTEQRTLSSLRITFALWFTLCLSYNFFKVIPSIYPEGINHANTQSILNYQHINSYAIYNGKPSKYIIIKINETINSIFIQSLCRNIMQPIKIMQNIKQYEKIGYVA